MKNDSFLITLCANICQLRQREGLSREEMAALLEIEENALEKIDSHNLPKELTYGALVRLSEHFDIELHKLFLPLE